MPPAQDVPGMACGCVKKESLAEKNEERATVHKGQGKVIGGKGRKKESRGENIPVAEDARTCWNCRYKCVWANEEPCEGCIKTSIFEQGLWQRPKWEGVAGG